ncbi:hypothetical protein D1AOALGA4SA_2331 [Olavius algarvensis Delta 1 endosymbiont]|nr:hypothetical protein D1AOALGA4SA_2331 [Olavius algarvensis Delta 1 endosymbiont]
MQIHNFYADPIPSVRNPLDSIVLSPHTLRTDHISLTDMEEDSSGYQSLLPSVDSCDYHAQVTCSRSTGFSKAVRDILGRVFKFST